MLRHQGLFWLGALAFLLAALYLLSGILLPFLVGCAIAYFLDPAVDRLETWRVPRGLATALVLLLFMLAVVLLLVLLLPLLQLQAAELARRAPAVVEFGRQKLEELMTLAKQQLAPDDLAKLKEIAGTWAGSVVGWAAALIERLVTSGVALANLLSLVVITPVVSFFLLRDWDRMMALIDSWLPRRHVETIREQARLVNLTLAGFVHGQVLVGIILAFYYAVALTLVGLNFAVILGIVIGLLSFIPYLGVATGLAMAMGLALLQFGAGSRFVIVLVIFALGHGVEGNFLSPKLVGQRVNLHPVWVIFSLLAFGSLFGFAGILLGVPAAAVIGVLVRFALGRYLASSLYDPANHPPAPRG